jgi:Na+/H+-dicarboxylate symporter
LAHKKLRGTLARVTTLTKLEEPRMSSDAAIGKEPMSLTAKILIGMIAGLVVGVILNLLNTPFLDAYLVDGVFQMVGKMFVNALKMLVVPLVVFSLLCGVLGIGDISVLGRVGGKSFALYLTTTAVAIMLAIALALLIGPGAGFDMQGVDVGGVTGKAAPSVWEVFANIVPSNPIQALANGEMLQIIFYVIVVGIAALMLGSESEGFVRACEYMNDLMMKVVTIVMHFAPYGVFALIARTFAQQGIDLFIPVLAYVVTLVAALAIHLFGTLMVMLKLFTGLSPLTFLRKIRPAQLFAFSTASSNATIPVTLRSVTARVGVDNSVASFTVPFGATINMDGTAIMQGVATVFLANVYGVALGLTGYATVILMAVLASIGTAGVPGVGLVMLTMVLGQVGLPIEGIALILGVDRLMDMMRTVVNISGDAVVTTIVAKSEGKVDLAVFDDPNAGILDSDDVHIDVEAEAALAKTLHEAEQLHKH